MPVRAKPALAFLGCVWYTTNVKLNTTVGAFLYAAARTEKGKRETGANPVRTRHRDREQEPQNHWETGKMADAMILSRETCLNAVQKRKFQTTSKKVVRLDL